MTDSKMLQVLIDGQVSLKKQIEIGFKTVDKEFKKVHERIDKIGKSLAFIETDTPTTEEFDDIEKRVEKIENKLQKSTFT